MTTTRQEHWETVYRNKRPDSVSWYQPHLQASLQLLERAGLTERSRIIDVGGGASTLVDDLLSRGLRHPSVLDISARSLAVSKTRLGKHAEHVEWIEADITHAQLPAHCYDLWHDRAVFHFLTTADERRCYVQTMIAALKPTGQVIMATFSHQGPPRCSGLEVVRYSPSTLQAELGNDFQLIEHLDEAHRTPFQTVQHFVYCRFRKIPAS